jgi:hypothetical protein
MVKRTVAGVGAALLLPTALAQVACGSTAQLVRWTQTVIGVLTDVSPILADMGAGSIVTLISRALPIAEKLKKAFQDNDHASTLTLLDNLINPQTGVIVDIANAVGALADDNRKRIVLGLLAIGEVALHLIAAQIQNEVPVSGAAAATAAQPAAAASVAKAANSDALTAAFNAARF